MSTEVLNFAVRKLTRRTFLGTLSRNGRNHFGRICVFHRGGGKAHKYRTLDFYRRLNQFCTVYKKMYDPNRSAFIGLFLSENGFIFNAILSEGVDIGDTLFFGDDEEVIKTFSMSADILNGYSMPLHKFSLFSIVNNVEIRPFFGSVLARAAGTGLFIVGITTEKIFLKSNSGWTIAVSPKCLCSLGLVSNAGWKDVIIRKAGTNRSLGKRPVVRGVAMNPCDHPHGGGEGKKASPRKQRSPWGKLSKGPHTKKKKVHKLNRRLFKKLR